MDRQRVLRSRAESVWNPLWPQNSLSIEIHSNCQHVIVVESYSSNRLVPVPPSPPLILLIKLIGQLFYCWRSFGPMLNCTDY